MSTDEDTFRSALVIAMYVPSLVFADANTCADEPSLSIKLSATAWISNEPVLSNAWRALKVLLTVSLLRMEALNCVTDTASSAITKVMLVFVGHGPALPSHRISTLVAGLVPRTTLSVIVTAALSVPITVNMKS